MLVSEWIECVYVNLACFPAPFFSSSSSYCHYHWCCCWCSLLVVDLIEAIVKRSWRVFRIDVIDHIMLCDRVYLLFAILLASIELDLAACARAYAPYAYTSNVCAVLLWYIRSFLFHYFMIIFILIRTTYATSVCVRMVFLLLWFAFG